MKSKLGNLTVPKFFLFYSAVLIDSVFSYNLANRLEELCSMNIYQDIANRTGGDIYIGVVGPVRTGKSAFVTRFMEQLVLPKITDVNQQIRSVDELPQSADGKIVMTTQPKFVPSQSVQLNLGDKMANVRLIDCVGYVVEGVEGLEQDGKTRLVKTPWSAEEMPFERAAELGTHKVVTEHSTVAVVVTNDGSITELPRSNYVRAEERVVSELKACHKPFVIVLNCREVTSESMSLADALSEKYGVTVIPLNVMGATGEQFESVLSAILDEFPVESIKIDLPEWMRTLDVDHPLISSLVGECKKAAGEINKMKDSSRFLESFTSENNLVPSVKVVDMATGVMEISVAAEDSLFYQVLSEQAHVDIDNEYSLMKFVIESAFAKRQYDTVKSALDQAQSTGYGVVCPDDDSIRLEEPEIVKQGSKFGVRLRATAPSLHIVKVDVSTEVSPIVGTEQQSRYLLSEFKQNPEQIWQTNMFGKPLSGLVRDGLTEKCVAMPVEMQEKLSKTVGRIVNEGKGGMICLLL